MVNRYGVPETHEEVVAYFENFPDKFMGECMLGIYECRLVKGEGVVLAYKNARRAGAGLPAIEAAQPCVQADGALCEDCGKNPVLEGCSVCAECGL